MYNLILKDLLISKKAIPVMFLYGIFALILFNEVAYTVGITVITLTLITRVGAYEEFDHGEILIVSLPVKRSRIVMAKYLVTIVYVLIANIAFWIGYMIFKLLDLPIRLFPITLTSVSAMIFGLGIIVASYYPLYFKYGYMKTKISFYLLLFGIIVVIPTIFFKLFPSDNKIYEYIIGLFDKQLILITLIILFLSYLLSVFIYNRREF